MLKIYSDPADDSFSFQMRFSFVPIILQNDMDIPEFFSSLLVLFPDEEAFEKFVEFGWRAGSGTEKAVRSDGRDGKVGVPGPSDGD